MPFINIENLSVEFVIYGVRSRSIKNHILSQATGGRFVASSQDIMTVRAIEAFNLDVKNGDRIGLVGHNGSGKTTLLRTIAGIYKPNRGHIDIEGRVTALIDLSAGMEPEATGLENIYLRGYMMGKSKKDIAARIDEISEFTELGQFLELPIRTYSAGMAARLTFAISTAWQSDILLIDEGIGAGDAEFQEKAKKRIENLFDRTPIMLLASHSEGLIKTFCNRRIMNFPEMDSPW